MNWLDEFWFKNRGDDDLVKIVCLLERYFIFFYYYWNGSKRNRRLIWCGWLFILYYRRSTRSMFLFLLCSGSQRSTQFSSKSLTVFLPTHIFLKLFKAFSNQFELKIESDFNLYSIHFPCHVIITHKKHVMKPLRSIIHFNGLLKQHKGKNII